MRILLVEDDSNLSEFLSQRLAEEQFSVARASDGREALRLLSSETYDLLVLDLSIPHVSGMDVLRGVRAQNPDVLVFVLTGNGNVAARVDAFNNGADDYLVKPFSFAELSARVRALLRRGRAGLDPVLKVGDLELDRFQRLVRRGGQPIALTHREFALLELLMLNAGQKVPRSTIVQRVWNLQGEARTNVVDVYINYLRKKIDSDSDSSHTLIHTIRGVGYQISSRPEKDASAVAVP